MNNTCQIRFRKLFGQLFFFIDNYEENSYFFRNLPSSNIGVIPVDVYQECDVISNVPWYVKENYEAYLKATKLPPIERPTFLVTEAIDNSRLCFVGSNVEEIIKSIEKIDYLNDIYDLQDFQYIFQIPD